MVDKNLRKHEFLYASYEGDDDDEEEGGASEGEGEGDDECGGRVDKGGAKPVAPRRVLEGETPSARYRRRNKKGV